jgi:hypothetical protein
LKASFRPRPRRISSAAIRVERINRISRIVGIFA